ncbi:MAG TPA: undecaprenyldiphospho-muramoylpentapeptide beta-N-acetylglucosaminyltransferase [Luteibaculaceae bacterium]|nr:undecaprenyldiphospho-muramoylpentapeptide beta-N-acetylglucosaminyltransferase [Luteibaculaceae bacterium]
MKLRKVIISGGGTGGHIFPALAIADELRRRHPDVDILFVGAVGRMEMEKVPQHGYPIEGLHISGLSRSLSLKNLSFPFKVIRSLIKAGEIIDRFQPDVAIGVGGYASGPLLYMAQKRNIPTLIQEQNSFPGITNKILGKRVSTICVAYSGLQKFFPANKLVLTGNPVRDAIKNNATTREEALEALGLDPEKPTILFVGGSLGARSINQAVHNGYQRILDAGGQIIWQTGKLFYSQHELELKNLASQLMIQPFIREMDQAYAAADVVVSRAGAVAITELCTVGKPSILVPSPYVSEDHQTKNAMSLVNSQAALIVKEENCADQLVQTAIELLGNRGKRLELAGKIAALARPNATEEIVDQIEKLVK